MNIGPIKNTKIYFLDNLKTIVVFLLVFVHVAIFFTPNIFNLFRGSSYRYFLGDSFFMGLFVFLCYSSLMGPFYFMMGYFGEQSIKKYGYLKFLIKKFNRFLLPFIIFLPITLLCFHVYYSEKNFPHLVNVNFLNEIIIVFPITKRFLSDDLLYKFFINPFHLWYVFTSFFLFLFYPILVNFFYFIYNKIHIFFGKINKYLNIIFLILSLALIGFILKIFPYPYEFLYKYRIDYYGIYLFYFFFGYLSYKKDLLKKEFNFNYKIFIIFVVFITFLSWYFFNLDFGYFKNGAFFSFSYKNLIFSLLQASLAIGINILLYGFTYKKLNYTNEIWDFLSKNSYGVFLIHYPLHFLFYKTFDFLLYFGNFTFLVFYSFFIILISYLLTFLIRKIPLFKQII